MIDPPRKDTFNVAAFQGPPIYGDVAAALDKTCEALEWADARGVHVLCMPEAFLTGYYPAREEARANSIDLDDPKFAAVLERLAPYDATLILGLNERRGDDLYNTAVVIERGRLVGKTSKRYLTYTYFRRGSEFPVFERDGVKFGISICADSTFVEPARIAAMRGAQIIFAPQFNKTRVEVVGHHTRRVRAYSSARAVENGCWFVRSNIIWPGGEGKLGLGDAFILNELGEPVAEASLVTETMLFHPIPRDRLAGDTPKFWARVSPEIARALADEYEKALQTAEVDEGPDPKKLGVALTARQYARRQEGRMVDPLDTDTFNVAAFQGRAIQGDPEAALDKTCEALEWADARGAHVLCMPETFLQGYFETREEALANSIDLESSEFAAVCDRVAGYDATLLLGLNERRGDDLYNTQVVIERGRLVGKYSKCYLVYKYFRRGSEFPVFERDGVKFGVIICADSSYVEPARIMAMRGAQVLFAPHFNKTRIEGVDHHTRRVRVHNSARAAENGCWLVRSNVVWPGGDGRLGVGDSFILNELGERVAGAGLMSETMLFHPIPRRRLASDSRKFWSRFSPEIVEAMATEYDKAVKAAMARQETR